MKANIFEGARFGDKYKTQDGRCAIFIKSFPFHNISTDKDYNRVDVVIEGDVAGFFFYENGTVELRNMNEVAPKDKQKYQIVGKWEIYPKLDEEAETKLNKILIEGEELRKTAEGRKETGGWYWRNWVEYGFRKAFKV